MIEALTDEDRREDGWRKEADGERTGKLWMSGRKKAEEKQSGKDL